MPTVAATTAPFTVFVRSLDSSGQPGLATFDMTAAYSWTLLTAGSISGFSAAQMPVDTSLFANPFGAGSFTVSQSGNELLLNFTPVPEPPAWVLLGAGAAVLGIASVWGRKRLRRV